VVFRRRRRDAEDAERPGYDVDDELDNRDDWPEAGDGEDQEPDSPGGGPWDAAESYPPGERVDLGGLLIPVREGFQIRLTLAEGVVGVSADVVQPDPQRGDSGLQLLAFAAPKTSGLWDDVRQEIAAEVRKSGGYSQEAPGPFGTELHAMVGSGGQGEHAEPHRFLGVDGPRWFLRGAISGPAASDPEIARPLEEHFADVVVVRGDDPMPPRERLPLRLPEDATTAEAEPEPPAFPNPFERGPEITEIR
jgi:hypothetical protein